MSRPIGTNGVIDTITVGGRVFTDLDTLIILYGSVGANGNSSFRLSNGTAGYQATAGKTLKIKAVRVQFSKAATNAGSNTVSLGYADNDLGINSATAPTNPVYQYGISANGQSGIPQVSVDGKQTELAISFDVIATKYPFITQTSTDNTQYVLFGYEV